MLDNGAKPLPYRAPNQVAGRFHLLPRAVHRLVEESDDAVLLETSRSTGASRKSYLFRNPVRVCSAGVLEDLPKLFREVEGAVEAGFYAAGYVGYECGYGFEPASLVAGERVGGGELPLVWFGLYRDPLIFDHETGMFDRSVSLPELLEESAEGGGTPKLEIGESAYAAQVGEIKRLIEAGDTYQVNLTTRVQLRAPGSLAAVFGQMMSAQPVEFGAFLKLGGAAVLSASPELFLRREGDAIEMRPMKGTVGRGMTTAEDARNAMWLAADTKNRSENVTIVDLLRNDLGRVCRMGTVCVEEMFTVERYPSVMQMVSTVRGVLRPEVSTYGLFGALFPSGSIVGAPKIRTMRIVRDLERRDRGVYTGAIGFLAPGRRSTFSVAIRTITVADGQATMGVGSGVVYDSDAAAEYEECRSKAGFLAGRADDFKLIETLLWDAGYTFDEEHLARLMESAEYFDFDLSKMELLRAVLADEAKSFAAGHRYRVRLLVDRHGAAEITSREIPLDEEDPCLVRLAGRCVSSADVFLRHKTTRRQVYDEAFLEAERDGFADAIFHNEWGEITEGAIHSVVVVKDGRWTTPPVSAGVLPGVFRAHLLARGDVMEETTSVAELLRADEIYLCNSVRGMRRVGRVDADIPCCGQ